MGLKGTHTYPESKHHDSFSILDMDPLRSFIGPFATFLNQKQPRFSAIIITHPPCGLIAAVMTVKYLWKC